MEKLQSQSQMLAARRYICYVVLGLLALLSVFPFYIMLINATRAHPQIQSGFSFFPSGSALRNFINLVGHGPKQQLSLIHI